MRTRQYPLSPIQRHSRSVLIVSREQERAAILLLQPGLLWSSKLLPSPRPCSVVRAKLMYAQMIGCDVS